jgi:acyl dehydratase
MTSLDLHSIEPGATLPPLTSAPITTRQLVEYASASLDWNRVHYDDPFARAGGHPSVIAHGMLSMGFWGRLLSQSFGGPHAIRTLRGRFRAITYPGDVITVLGTVSAVRFENEERLIEFALVAKNQSGTTTVEGTATLAVST